MLTLARKLPKLKDTLVLAKFEFMTRHKGHDRSMESINAAINLGHVKVRFSSEIYS